MGRVGPNSSRTACYSPCGETGLALGRIRKASTTAMVKRLAVTDGVRGNLSEGDREENFSGHSRRGGLASSAEIEERYVQKHLGHASAEMNKAAGLVDAPRGVARQPVTAVLRGRPPLAPLALAAISSSRRAARVRSPSGLGSRKCLRQAMERRDRHRKGFGVTFDQIHDDPAIGAAARRKREACRHPRSFPSAPPTPRASPGPDQRRSS